MYDRIAFVVIYVHKSDTQWHQGHRIGSDQQLHWIAKRLKLQQHQDVYADFSLEIQKRQEVM